MSKQSNAPPPTRAQSKRATTQEVFERVVRIESRLVKLMLAAGLNENGDPAPRRTGK